MSKPLKVNEKIAPMHLNPIPWEPSLLSERGTRCCLFTGDRKPVGRRLHNEERPIPLSRNRRDSELTPPPGGTGLEEAWLQQRLMDSDRKRKLTTKKKGKTLRRRYVLVKQLLVRCTVFGLKCARVDIRNMPALLSIDIDCCATLDPDKYRIRNNA